MENARQYTLRGMKRASLLAAIAAVALVSAAWLSAHEIPRRVTVHAFVAVDQRQLSVLVRVPLAAMRDVDFPQRDGFLDIAGSEAALHEAAALWILPDFEVFEDGRLLPPPRRTHVRVSLPSDRSFTSYSEALAHVNGPPLEASVHLPWEQALLDVSLEYPIASENASFSIRPGFQRLGVDVVTVLRFVTRDTVRGFEWRGDPGLVRLDPRWHHAAAQFVKHGFLHILDGIDHLLFLACLVIPLRRLRPLVLVVTMFTVAHSITLTGAAMGLAPDALWFPPLVELLIAASIVYVAIENVVAAPSISRRCAVAFGFGLVHGFGFAFALKETLQFAGAHLLTSLVSFNVGVELGQLLVVGVLAGVLHVAFRSVAWERPATVVLSVLVGHTAWHWMTERWATLRAFEAPTLDGPALLALTRSALVILVLAAMVWLMRRMLASRHPQSAVRDQ